MASRNARGSKIGGVELRVQQDGQDQLVYRLSSVEEAAAILDVISDSLPGARFVIQPLMH